MNVEFIAPLSRAWQRMLNLLFRPFRIETWFVVGLSAFLTWIGQSGGGSGKMLGIGSRGGSSEPSPAALEHVRQQVLYALGSPFWLGVIAAALTLLAILLVVVAWVSARARFVFLHNVATGRAEFRAAWRRFARLGQSLFLWIAVFSFAWLLPLGVLFATFAGTLLALLGGRSPELPAIGAMLGGCAFALLLSLAIGFISLMMDDFVVPLMYRHDETAMQAWARFRPLLTRHLGEFFAFTLFLVVLWIAAVILLVLAGLATCCVGLIAMAIPYVGTVLLLPLYVTDRAFSLEFLAQFGPDWDVFPPGAPAAGAGTPGTDPAAQGF